MADAIDMAQQRSEEVLARSIAQIIHRPVAVSATFCEECDTPIPEARRRAIYGVIRCVSCQQIFELKATHFKGH